MLKLPGWVEHLENDFGQPDGGPCPYADRPTVILHYRRGEPEPRVPQDAARCELCVEVHSLYLEEVIVTSRAELEAIEAGDRRPKQDTISGI
jgi:hypothetical protein